jgi:hypothetical protein
MIQDPLFKSEILLFLKQTAHFATGSIKKVVNSPFAEIEVFLDKRKTKINHTTITNYIFFIKILMFFKDFDEKYNDYILLEGESILKGDDICFQLDSYLNNYYLDKIKDIEPYPCKGGCDPHSITCVKAHSYDGLMVCEAEDKLADAFTKTFFLRKL